MRKFTDGLDFSKNKGVVTSSDIISLDDQISKEVDGAKLDGEWEIVSVIDVTTNSSKIDESLVINAEIGDRDIKRGDVIYITAQIRKKGDTNYNMSKMGVIKCTVRDIFNTMSVLNNLK